MKRFNQFSEDIEITSNRYNDLVSRRQMKDKKRNRRKIEHEFSRSENQEKKVMKKEAEKTYGEEVDYSDWRKDFKATEYEFIDLIKPEPMQGVSEETYDPEVQGRSQIRKTGEGGRKYPSKKKSKPEIRRQKAIGGGKTAPVEYKDRKDIGKDKPRSEREQQPQKERGSKEVAKSYADAVKAKRREDAKKRAAAKKAGTTHETGVKKTSGKDASKQANKLLSKKTEKKVSPDYKPAKASGMTRQERMSQQRKGESKLKGIMKQQETDKYKKATGQNPDRKAKTKILGRVAKRMAS